MLLVLVATTITGCQAIPSRLDRIVGEALVNQVIQMAPCLEGVMFRRTEGV